MGHLFEVSPGRRRSAAAEQQHRRSSAAAEQQHRRSSAETEQQRQQRSAEEEQQRSEDGAPIYTWRQFHCPADAEAPSEAGGRGGWTAPLVETVLCLLRGLRTLGSE